PCGQTYFYDEKTNVKSPNHPYSYPNNLDCQYHIFLQPGKRACVEFSRIEVERFTGEKYDIKICGFENSLTIWFTADDQMYETGFNARITMQEFVVG
ncbi:hypothetical protein MAR_027715, partial [Mya arenaria]